MNCEIFEGKLQTCQICFNEIAGNELNSNLTKDIDKDEDKHIISKKASLECGCVICLECFFIWICFFNDINYSNKSNSKKNVNNNKSRCESKMKQLNVNSNNYIKFICANYSKCCSEELTFGNLCKILMLEKEKYDLRINVINQISKRFQISNDSKNVYYCPNNKCNLPSYLPKILENKVKSCNECFECPYCYHKWNDELYIVNRTEAAKKHIHNFYTFLMYYTNFNEIFKFYTRKTNKTDELICMLYTYRKSLASCIFCEIRHSTNDSGDIFCVTGIMSRFTIVAIIVMNLIRSYFCFSYDLNLKIWSGIIFFIYQVIIIILTFLISWGTFSFIIIMAIIFGILKDNGFKNTFNNYLKIRNFKSRNYMNTYFGFDYNNIKMYYLIKLMIFVILIFSIKMIHLMNNGTFDNDFISFSIHSKSILSYMKYFFIYNFLYHIFRELRKLNNEENNLFSIDIMQFLIKKDQPNKENKYVEYLNYSKAFILALTYKIASILINSLASFQTYLEFFEFE